MFLTFFFFLFIGTAPLALDSLRYKSLKGLKVGFIQVGYFCLIKNISNILFFLFVGMASLALDSLKHESLESLKVGFN